MPTKAGCFSAIIAYLRNLGARSTKNEGEGGVEVGVLMFVKDNAVCNQSRCALHSTWKGKKR